MAKTNKVIMFLVIGAILLLINFSMKKEYTSVGCKTQAEYTDCVWVRSIYGTSGPGATLDQDLDVWGRSTSTCVNPNKVICIDGPEEEYKCLPANSDYVKILTCAEPSGTTDCTNPTGDQGDYTCHQGDVDRCVAGAWVKQDDCEDYNGPLNEIGYYTSSCNTEDAMSSAIGGAVTDCNVASGTTYSCTSKPSNADACTGDETGLTANVVSTVVTSVSACTSTKCEFYCKTGYEKSGNTCVASSGSFSCTGTLPSNINLCPNYNVGLTANTPYTYTTNCASTKCGFACKPDFTYSNGQCVDVFVVANSESVTVSGNTIYVNTRITNTKSSSVSFVVEAQTLNESKKQVTTVPTSVSRCDEDCFWNVHKLVQIDAGDTAIIQLPVTGLPVGKYHILMYSAVDCFGAKFGPYSEGKIITSAPVEVTSSDVEPVPDLCVTERCGDGVCQASDPLGCSDCVTLVCGNGHCDTGETLTNCPGDCHCGDGTCNNGETLVTCVADCSEDIITTCSLDTQCNAATCQVCKDGKCSSACEFYESCDEGECKMASWIYYILGFIGVILALKVISSGSKK